MTITINGRAMSLDGSESTALEGYLENQGIKLDRVAVERNGEIVPRAVWQEVHLAEGDRLEIVHFVGGGSASKRVNSCSHRSP